jgi:hypothetical protein
MGQYHDLYDPIGRRAAGPIQRRGAALSGAQGHHSKQHHGSTGHDGSTENGGW